MYKQLMNSMRDIIFPIQKRISMFYNRLKKRWQGCYKGLNTFI